MRFYTVSELARAIGTSTQYVRQELQIGRIKGSKAGNFWIIDEDEVSDQVAKRFTARSAEIIADYTSGEI